MKKILLSLSVIFAFILYSMYQKSQDLETNIVVSAKTRNSTPNISPEVNREYKNGEYIGDVIDVYYGNVQVKAIITNGKIADVQFLQYPNARRASIKINTQAMPYLKQEAIQVQNANVDIVTGATQTSHAFRQSLQFALNKAKI